MKEVEVDEQKILLVRTQGLYSAVGSKCSHYGAPLIKGIIYTHMHAQNTRPHARTLTGG
jgi:nitrite reductase/ring-hydroxylating ferredoxin subunit